MWILVLMFLLAVPAWAEDLGELSANPARLSFIWSLWSVWFLWFSLMGFVIRPTRQTRQTR